jgi:hypothetical protein
MDGEDPDSIYWAHLVVMWAGGGLLAAGTVLVLAYGVRSCLSRRRELRDKRDL